MIKVIVAMVHGALYGAVVGLIWWLALGTIYGLYISALVGAVLGVLVGLMAVAASSRGAVNDRESMFVSGSLLMLAAMAGGIGGLAVWAYRALFS